MTITMETIKAKEAEHLKLTDEEQVYKRHAGVPVIRCHADAWAHWESRADERDLPNGDRFLGDARYKNRTMRCLDDGSIAIFYKGEHLITYHPDGTISASGLSRQANGSPDPQVFPGGLWWSLVNRVGPVIYSVDRSDMTDEEITKYSWWRLWRVKDEKGRMVPNPKILVMRAESAAPARLHLVGKRWEPVDLDQLLPIKWTTFDTRAARGASDKQGIPDFVQALDAYMALGAELPPFEEDVSLEELLRRLRKQDFVGVMAGLPRNSTYLPWQPGQQRQRGPDRVKPSALTALRTRAIVEAGATFQLDTKLATLPEFQRIERQLKRFGVPD